jgi:uncharacterized protein (TIRG00374 family)
MASFIVQHLASLRRPLLKVLPWAITIAALYYTFKGISISVLVDHLHEAKLNFVFAALLLTSASYLLRAYRWQKLFPVHTLSYANAARVLFLGFFMNNILPARAGEFVRAHMGARVSGETRTLVLATIASERLVDGLTISFLFVLFSLGMGDADTSHNMLLVAWLFAGAGASVVAVLLLREQLLSLAGRLHRRIDSPRSEYLIGRLELFLHGLSPLCSLRKAIPIALWSFTIWGVELLVYGAVTRSFGADLTWAQCVLFLVAVNFSSLIPAAPGGIGVIEAVATTVLVSVGVEREHALTMAICQHFIQYLVVGIPGAIIMLNWKKTIEQARAMEGRDSEGADLESNSKAQSSHASQPPTEAATLSGGARLR